MPTFEILTDEALTAGANSFTSASYDAQFHERNRLHACRLQLDNVAASSATMTGNIHLEAQMAEDAPFAPVEEAGTGTRYRVLGSDFSTLPFTVQATGVPTFLRCRWVTSNFDPNEACDAQIWVSVE